MYNTLKQFKKVAIPEVKKEFGFKNDMQVPRVAKVTINVGTGPAKNEPKFLELMEKNIIRITGQKPVRTIAKKSIAGFDVKENSVVGLKVVLRRQRMYDFLDRLINTVLPRMRDFKGLGRNSFDGQGNYSIGVQEHTVFPEIGSDEVEKIHGLEIVISTTAKTDKEGLALLTAMGFPFTKKKDTK